MVAGCPVGRLDHRRVLKRQLGWLVERGLLGQLIERQLERRRLGLSLATVTPAVVEPADQTRSGVQRPLGPWAFAGVAISSFGGPLALAALGAPGLIGDASNSAGLAMLAAVAVFTIPLAIWLRYSRHVASSGGLYAFVEAAAGRRVAIAQAAIWIVSYLLYLVYTTVQIVYDVLPAAIPGEHS